MIISGALTFLHALVLPKFLPNFFIGLCYVITTTSMRASLFNNMVLAAIRTINIKIPFYRIKKRLVVAVVVMCPVFWAVLSIWEFIACKEGGAKGWPIIFFLIIQNPGFDLIHSDSFGWLKEYANYIDNIVSMWLPFVLPCIILLVCATIQSYTLLMYKKPTEVKERKRLSREKSMTITILMLTAWTLVCNLPYTLHKIHMYIPVEGNIALDLSLPWMYAVGTILQFVNAAVNPLILIMRCKNLRVFLVNIFKSKNDKKTEGTSGYSNTRTYVESVNVSPAQETKLHGANVVTNNVAMMTEIA